jgi:hypothetical protein
MAAEFIAWYAFGGERDNYRLPRWCPHSRPLPWLRGSYLLWRKRRERCRG